MATTLRELLVKIGVDADTEELEAFDGAVERGKEALGNLVQVATAAAAAVAAVAAATIAGAVSTAGYARTVDNSRHGPRTVYDRRRDSPRPCRSAAPVAGGDVGRFDRGGCRLGAWFGVHRGVRPAPVPRSG